MELSTVVRVLSEHDDYQTVTDYASEYGEPGYTSDGPILFGDWWCRRKDCDYAETYENGAKKVHGLDCHYPRVFAFLEENGAQLEWDDEWTVVDDKAYRTSADSYSWQPTAVWNDDVGDYMVNGEDIDTWLEWAVNDSSRCLMARSFTDAELEAEGFVERQCDFYNGWHEGMADDPKAIMAMVQDSENVDVLFMLAETSQFYIRFCVYVREVDSETDDD
jgi:hypothetical protein